MSAKKPATQRHSFLLQKILTFQMVGGL